MESYREVVEKALAWELETLKKPKPEAHKRVLGLIGQIAAVLDANLKEGGK